MLVSQGEADFKWEKPCLGDCEFQEVVTARLLQRLVIHETWCPAVALGKGNSEVLRLMAHSLTEILEPKLDSLPPVLYAAASEVLQVAALFMTLLDASDTPAMEKVNLVMQGTSPNKTLIHSAIMQNAWYRECYKEVASTHVAAKTLLPEMRAGVITVATCTLAEFKNLVQRHAV